MKNSQSDSERFIEALEADNQSAESLSAEDRQIHLLGTQLREFAKHDLPSRSESLKEKLLDRLDSESLATAAKEQKPVSKSNSNVARIALAASLLLALGLVGLALQTSQHFESVRERATVSGIEWADAERRVAEVAQSGKESAEIEKKYQAPNFLDEDYLEQAGTENLDSTTMNVGPNSVPLIRNDMSSDSSDDSGRILNIDSYATPSAPSVNSIESAGLNKIATLKQPNAASARTWRQFRGVNKSGEGVGDPAGDTELGYLDKADESSDRISGATIPATVPALNEIADLDSVSKSRFSGQANQRGGGAGLGGGVDGSRELDKASEDVLRGARISTPGSGPFSTEKMEAIVKNHFGEKVKLDQKQARNGQIASNGGVIGGIGGIGGLGGGGRGRGGGGGGLGGGGLPLAREPAIRGVDELQSGGDNLIEVADRNAQFQAGFQVDRQISQAEIQLQVALQRFGPNHPTVRSLRDAAVEMRRMSESRSGGEEYDAITENEFFKVAGEKALSTFSIDVDTASYANMRRFLQSGQRPPRNAVRIEELVNYFNYDYPQPEGDRPFAVNMEIANCPWNEQHHLLRVALKGKEIHRSERSPSNIVFLLDVSGSMQDQNKLPLLKQGLMMMVQQLSENDSVSIVTYAGNAGVVLNPTNGENKRQIEQAIESLNSGGSTNGSAGIELAYELAQKQFIKKGSNRVILATDGDLNVGVTSDGALVELIKRKASEGVFLTVLGFGTGNLKDSKLEKLADNGNGMYAYIDNFREAHKVLIEQMSGSLETIAKDVKIQIEFNPGEVESYRLIGYENRVLAAQDFDNDRKDAGEIGAGHSVTALYELVLSGGSKAAAVLQQQLKYQKPEQASEKPAVKNRDKSTHTGELLTLALRYKKPDAQTSERIEFTLSDEPSSFSSASSEFRFAAAVASFGMILRQSQYCGSTSLKWVEDTASRSLGDDSGGYRAEFLDLVRRASSVR